jgi:pyrroloquinoline quinone biosynthesis protein B
VNRRKPLAPVDGPDGSLARIAGHPGIRWCYTRLTNPVLDRRSRAYAAAREAGVSVPLDGDVLVVRPVYHR